MTAAVISVTGNCHSHDSLHEDVRLHPRTSFLRIICIYASLRSTLHPTSFASYTLIICKLQDAWCRVPSASIVNYLHISSFISFSLLAKLNNFYIEIYLKIYAVSFIPPYISPTFRQNKKATNVTFRCLKPIQTTMINIAGWMVCIVK